MDRKLLFFDIFKCTSPVYNLETSEIKHETKDQGG